MTFVRHGTLPADAVTIVELPPADQWDQVEVTNVDGAAAIYFQVLRPSSGLIVDVEADDCELVPAAICSLVVDIGTDEQVQLEMISTGTPKYSVKVWSERT